MGETHEQRVSRTRARIRRSFLDLVHEEGFSNVNVKRIAERAEINRGTFYLHYTDKFDLINEIEDDILSRFELVVMDAPFDMLTVDGVNWDSAMQYFSRMVEYVHENGEVFILLRSDRGDPQFASKFEDLNEKVWHRGHVTERLSIPNRYALTGLISMMTSLIEEWVNSGFRESPEEFIQIVLKLFRGIPANIIS